MKPRKPRAEIMRKAHAHRSAKDYTRDDVVECYLIDTPCPDCGGQMAAGGEGGEYTEFCVRQCCQECE